MTDGDITLHRDVAYGNHDGVELLGDLYLPKSTKSAPALVAVHGGGWIAGVRGAFQYWGPYLAARCIAVFAISYRLATKTSAFPQAVQDVLAGVQFVRGKASAFGIDAARTLPQAPTLRRLPRSAARHSPAAIRRTHSLRSSQA